MSLEHYMAQMAPITLGKAAVDTKQRSTSTLHTGRYDLPQETTDWDAK